MRVRSGRKEEKKKAGGRFGFVSVFFLILLGVVGLRLLWIIAFDGNKYAKAALAQSETSSITISSKRGDIIDRNNVQLATSTKVYNLILDPAVILTKEEKYLEPTVSVLAELFGFSADELKQTIHDNPKRHYIVLERGLTYAQVEPLIERRDNDSAINGIALEETYKRNYTYGPLASSVIGFTDGGTGTYGLEYAYNEQLTGNDGMEYSYVNSNNVIERVRKDAEDGNTIKTTIDYNIQSIVEKQIEYSMYETGAKSAACIVQNPNTGEIYAMADTKRFDPNEPRNMSYSYTPEQIAAMSDEDTINALSDMWKNYCVTQSYEPGSTFKPFTVAMALEENTISPYSTYHCDGSRVFFPGGPWERTIWCYERSGHGDMDLRGVVAQSCNISVAAIAGTIGVDKFCKYQSKFGFGEYTGIDLPNEMSCENLLYRPHNMTELDLATNAFGQNFNLTMVQLSTGFCSLINGGFLYKPYMVKGIYNDKGELIRSVDRTLVSQTISADTSVFLKDCLRAVVTEGSGVRAAIPGYKIAGKTGTAQKYDKQEDLYVISFIGFAPYDDPQVVCYVTIDEPATGDASGYAAVAFSRIMTEVISYMNIAPDDIYW